MTPEARHVRQHAQHLGQTVEGPVGEPGVADLEDPLRLTSHPAVPIDIAWRYGADVLEQPLIVACVVEGGTVVEEDTVERIDRDEVEVVARIAADEREELIEQIRRRDDRGAGVEGEAIAAEDSRAATGLVEC